MEPGKFTLLQTIIESQPDETFKFKKMKNTPARIYEKNILLITSASLMLMILHSLFMVVKYGK